MTRGLAIRATPPAARMSAGTRSRAITAQAPASSAIRACSAVVTSMITPPLSISARPRLTRNVARSAIEVNIDAGSGVLHEPLDELGATPVGVELELPKVRVDVTVRVARLARRYRAVAFDRQRPVLGLPGSRLVAIGEPA